MDEKFNKSPIDIINKRKELWKRYHDLDIDRSYMEAISNYMVTSAGEELRKAIRNEPRLLIEMFFVIVDKNMETIPEWLKPIIDIDSMIVCHLSNGLLLLESCNINVVKLTNAKSVYSNIMNLT